MQTQFFGEWQTIFNENQLGDFEKLWQHQVDWFEPPNYRRGGWSGVNKIEINLPNQQKQTIFLKRQYNHGYRPWWNPLKKIPTFRREIINILRFRKDGIATLTPVFYGEKNTRVGSYALLLTKSLENYISLLDYLSLWNQGQNLDFKIKNENIKKLADYIHSIHQHGYFYCCLYAKHIMVKSDEKGRFLDIKMVDLEKLRRWFLPKNRMLRDLGTLYRTSRAVPARDLLRFMCKYLQHESAVYKKKLFKLLLKRIRRKHNYHALSSR